jgi:hypothetical protein
LAFWAKNGQNACEIPAIARNGETISSSQARPDADWANLEDLPSLQPQARATSAASKTEGVLGKPACRTGRNRPKRRQGHVSAFVGRLLQNRSLFTYFANAT